ncbi:MAG: CopG family transcriptional regulator [Clostridia bacterium]|nr:CopG family transcriptional regulator [Clostridia bacterium]
MSPRTGRPKSDNPKAGRVGVRLDMDTVRKLDELVISQQTTRSEIVRQGIEKVYDEKKK